MYEPLGVNYQKRIPRSVEVLVPPGRASCFLDPTLNSKYQNYKEVHCHATAGNTHTASLGCFQGNGLIPPNGDTVFNRETIRAKFWMRLDMPTLAVSCCSFVNDRPINQTSCSDFIWGPSATIKDDTLQNSPIPQDYVSLVETGVGKPDVGFPSVENSS